jgi:hypothetical protein
VSVYTRSPFGWDYCEAGRRAKFGGRWRHLAPCTQPGNNVIGSPGPWPAVKLCDEHFMQVREAGLVEEVNIGEPSFRERYGGGGNPFT